MNLNEAKKILNDNGYKVELNEDLRKARDEVKAAAKGWFKMPQNESTITEASKYDYEYEYDLLKREYFPDAKDIDIHANRSIRNPLWKTLYGWECEFTLNGKRHWFTFGKGGSGFEPSLQAYIRKYCKLESFKDYKEIKEEYPDATLEDIRNIATMG